MKKLKLAGMEDTGSEARERFHLMISTRETTRAETDSLFENAKASRARDRAVVKKHFIQAPAVVTMAPNLQAEPPSEAKTASVAPHVDEWFEKNASAIRTVAQRRYPELLKAASSPLKVPITSSRTKTPAKPIPSQSMLSGGSA